MRRALIWRSPLTRRFSHDQVNARRDGRSRSIERIEVITLTAAGEKLARRSNSFSPEQRLYHGLVKPREAEHDAQNYRAYRKEWERIEKEGGANPRVRLDFELKSEVQRAIYADDTEASSFAQQPLLLLVQANTGQARLQVMPAAHRPPVALNRNLIDEPPFVLPARDLREAVLASPLLAVVQGAGSMGWAARGLWPFSGGLSFSTSVRLSLAPVISRIVIEVDLQSHCSRFPASG